MAVLSGTNNSDSITGTSNADTIVGGNGDDTLTGGNGDDVLGGGNGADSFRFDAGWGNDTIEDYEHGTDQLDLSGTSLTFADLTITQEGTDALIAAPDGNTILLKNATASELTAADLNIASGTITGTDGADSLVGGNGDDTINGLAGNDTLVGGLGDDLLSGSNGDDLFVGGVGADTIIGSYGYDSLSYAANNVAVSVSNNGLGGFASGRGGDAEGDKIMGVTIVGTNFGDYFYGVSSVKAGDGDDTITGTTIGSHLEGEGGNDLITGSGPWDYLSGGAGNDTLISTDESVLSPFGPTVMDGGDGDDVIREGMEGMAADKEVYGGEGNDTITTWGYDTVWAGNGDDVITANLSGQFVTAGGGDDIVDISLTSRPVLFFGAGWGNDTLIGFGNHDEIFDILDTGLSFEDLTISQQNDDVFVSDGNGNSILITDTTVDAVTEDHFVDQVVFSGTSGSDTIQGTYRADTISGDAGNDVLDGGLGDDIISGGFGADAINGGYGDNTLTGGADADVFVFNERWGYAVVTDFVVGTDRIDLSNIGANFDELTIEQQGDDVLVSYLSSSILLLNFSASDVDASLLNMPVETTGIIVTGTSGSDFYQGGAGDDTIVASAGGIDTVNGGEGFDILDFSSLGHGVIAEMSGPVWDADSSSRLLIPVIEEIEGMIGSHFSDSLEGSVGNDLLSGNGGYDILDGLAGNDTLIGGDDGDWLVGGAGADILSGSAGRDSFVFGNGWGQDTITDYEISVDEVIFSDGSANFDALTITQEGSDVLVADGAGNTILFQNQSVADFGSEEVFSGAGLLLEGTDGADQLVGSDKDDTLLGVGGRDTLYGHGGNDSLDGGNGDDILEGGSGHDFIIGGNGDDIIRGGVGDDTISMGFSSHAGADTITGGAGADFYDHITSLQSDIVITDFTVNEDVLNLRLLVSRWDQLTITDDRGDAVIRAAGETGSIRLLGVSAGSISSQDLGFWASGADDNLAGTDGPDTIDGLAGADTIYGGAGSDLLSGGDGADILFAGEGDDVLLGGNNDDEIFGGDGNDDISAGNGDDTVFAGSGSDSVDGGDGNDRIYTSSGNDTVYGGAGSDTLIGASSSTTLYGEDGNDLLEGSSEADLIVGGAGNDALWGYHGDDTLDGGDDQDIALFDGESAAVNVDLSIGVAITPTGTVKLINIEDASGTNEGDDTLVGSNGDNYLGGQYGNDRLFGREGDDQLSGGSGNDTLDGGAGDDRLSGSSGSDRFAFGAGWGQDTISDFTKGEDQLDLSDTGLYFQHIVITQQGDNALVSDGAGNSILLLNTSAASLEASDLNLTAGELLEGTSQGDALTGGCGDDTLVGRGGNDDLFGGSGDDLLIPGMGADAVFGGNGDDTIEITSLDGDVLDGDDGQDRILVDLSDADGLRVTFTDEEAGVIRLGDNNQDFDHIESIMVIGNGASTLAGTIGDQELIGGNGDDVIIGGLGNDMLAGRAGADRYVFSDGWGHDTVSGYSSGADTYDLSTTLVTRDDITLSDVAGGVLLEAGGNSIFFADVTQADIDLDDFLFTKVVNGSNGDDSLTGDSQDNYIWGGCGDDVVDGGAGADSISGGCGDDTLSGGCGDDTIEGGDGADLIIGGAGADFVLGGCGDDTVQAIFIPETDEALAAMRAEAPIQFSAGHSAAGVGLDPAIETSQITVSEDGLSYVYEGGRDRGGIPATEEMASGQHYWELTLDDVSRGGSGLFVAIAAPSDSDWSQSIATVDGSLVLRGNGQLYLGTGSRATRIVTGLDRIGEGDVIGVAFDADSGALWLSINGEWQNGATAAEIAAGDTSHAVLTGIDEPYVPTAGGYATNSRAGHEVSFSFDDDSFSYSAPDGFSAYGGGAVGDAGDTLDGGDGVDWIDLSNAPEGIDMTGTSLSDTGDTEIAGDIYRNFENIRGSGCDDVLNGGEGDNFIDGGNGDDTLSGGAGNDTLVGGFGDDSLSGGDGDDLIQTAGDYPITASIEFTGNGDMIINEDVVYPEEIDVVHGGNGDDTIDASGSYEIVVSGGDGNDLLTGLDVLAFVRPGDGNDTIEGIGSGNLIYRDSSAAIHYDVGAGTVTSAAGNDIIRQFDVWYMEASDFGDTIDGSGGASAIDVYAANGDDMIIGSDFDDTIIGGYGDDTIWFSGGADELDGEYGQDVLNLTLGDDLFDLSTGSLSGHGTASILDIEVIDGVGGNDTIIGSANADRLNGGCDDDRLVGGEGDDTLTGGEDNDTFVFEPDFGFDVVADFASGQDTIDLSAIPVTFSSLVITQDGGDTIVEVQGYGEITLVGVTATDLTSADFYFGDTSLEGTASDDLLEGLFRDETLDGFAGDDTLLGGEGNDTLLGGAGNDTLDGGAGADVIMGGCGDDLVQAFAGASGSDKALNDATHAPGVTVAGDGITYTYEGGRDREGVAVSEEIDSGQYYWEITLTDVARGGGHLFVAIAAPADSDWTQDLGVIDGALMLRGTGQTYVGNGSRLLRGERGLDRVGEGDVIGVAFDADAGAIWISVNGEWQNGATAAEIAAGDTSHAIMTGIDVPYVPTAGGYSSSSRAGHTATFSFDTDSFSYAAPEGFSDYAAAGAPEGGNDTVDGGEGVDVIDFSGLSVGVDMAGVSLSDAGGALIGADLYQNFENIIGSNQDDFLNGGEGNNDLVGGDGNDTINAGDGHDTLYGETGDDLLIGGAGNDVIIVGSGNDRVVAGEGNDSVLAGDGINTIEGGAGDDFINSRGLLDGGAGDDQIYGSTGDDTIIGGAGNDDLRGGGGADTFKFGSGWGHDTLGGFELGIDKINLQGSGLTIVDVMDWLDGPTSTLLVDGDGNSIELRSVGVSSSTLSLSDFVFGGNVILGTDNAETLTGSANADNIIGLGGADSLYGGAGDDTLMGSTGDDTLDGGAGFDHIGFGGGDDRIDLATGTAAFGAAGEGIDILIDIEAAHGGAGADTLIGGAGDESLAGDAGDDALLGGAGDDTLSGGAGADSFVFGDGWGADVVQDFTVGADNLDFSISTLSLGDLTVTDVDGDAVVADANGNSITLVGVDAASVGASNFSFGDTLTGTAANDSLTGGLGRDSIVGLAGDDTILSGGGYDTIDGGAGNDWIEGGAGADMISAGCGDDTVGVYGGEEASSGVALEDASHAPQVTVGEDFSYVYSGGRSREGVAATDEMSSGQHYWEITLTDVVRGGSSLFVAIAAPADSDWSQDLGNIDGSLMLRGNGQTYVGNGRRISRDERGLDSVGEGDVIGVAFDADTGAIWLSINGEWQNGATAAEIAAGDISHAIMTGITEPYVPTAGGYDSSGRGGHSATFAFSADDFTYMAPEGFSPYAGEPTGGDTVDGGEGFDIIDFTSLSAGVDMTDISLSDEGGALIGGDLYQNFEGVNGSGHADLLRGGNDANMLSGDAGDDTIAGGVGDDTLTGGTGVDTFLFGSGFGNDVVTDFDISTDLLDLRGAGFNFVRVLAGLTQDGADAVFSDGNGNTLRLIGVTATDVTVANFIIEGTVRLGADSDDTLSGDDGDDYAIGLSGNDMLSTEGGNDTLDGGAGNDTLEGGSGDDTLVGGDGHDRLTGGVGSDRFVMRSDDIGNDQITDFDVDSDILDLSATTITANTLLDEGAEETTLNGISGVLLTDALGSTVFIQDLSLGDLMDASILFSGETDVPQTLDGQRLRGSNRSDAVTGTNGDDVINSRRGDDTINGGVGDDTLTGSRGDDQFVFSANNGNDVITDFSVRDDTLDLSGVAAGFVDLNDVLAASVETTHEGKYGLLIDLSDGNTVFLEGISLSDFAAANVGL